MRTAAGLLMVFFGMTTVLIYVATLSHYGLPDYDLPPLSLTLFIIDSAVFVTTAGVFCLTRRYWKVCFSSALLFHCWDWGHSPNNLRLSQEKRVVRISGLTGFFYEPAYSCLGLGRSNALGMRPGCQYSCLSIPLD